MPECVSIFTHLLSSTLDIFSSQKVYPTKRQIIMMLDIRQGLYSQVAREWNFHTEASEHFKAELLVQVSNGL